MTTPSSVPTPTALPPQTETVTPEVIATATRVVRVKSVLKNSFKTGATAVVGGVVAAALVSRSNRKQSSDTDLDTVDDTAQ